MPSPDWDGVELRWSGHYLDGSPVTGRLVVTATEPRFLDDAEGAELATAVYAVPIVVPIVDGYASITVPATDDPDITPNGFEYTITEELDRGQGGSITVPVLLAHAATGIDLNRRFAGVAA